MTLTRCSGERETAAALNMEGYVKKKRQKKGHMNSRHKVMQLGMHDLQACRSHFNGKNLGFVALFVSILVFLTPCPADA